MARSVRTTSARKRLGGKATCDAARIATCRNAVVDSAPMSTPETPDRSNVYQAPMSAVPIPFRGSLTVSDVYAAISLAQPLGNEIALWVVRAFLVAALIYMCWLTGHAHNDGEHNLARMAFVGVIIALLPIWTCKAPLVVVALSFVLGGCENKLAQPPIPIASPRVISVGDDASVLRAFKDCGYSEEHFSVIPYPGPDGSMRTPRFFHLGNKWYIRVWHGDRIERITHFRAVPHEHEYTDFIDDRELTSFTIPELGAADAGSIDAGRGELK